MSRRRALAAALSGSLALAALVAGFAWSSSAARSAIGWLVAVVDAATLPGQEWEGYICSGALLSPTVVVTAAHCVADHDDDLDIVLGAADLCDEAPRLRVAAREIHSGFDPSTLEHDVALLRLEAPVEHPSVPIALTPPEAGTTATVAGYGPSRWTDLWECRPFRKQVQVQAPAACAEPPDGRVLVFRSSLHLCVGPSADGPEACPGDSGAPLLVHEPFGSATVVGL